MKRLSLAVFVVLLVASATTAQAQLSLSGTGSSDGIDWNGNGLFDFLHISVGLNNAGSASYYRYTVQLTDKNGTVLGSQADIPYFIGAGTTSINLYFDGSVIGQNGVNGPYYLTNLTLKNMFGDDSLTAQLAFTTDAFQASEFEGFHGVVDTTPPTVTVVATPSVLWPPDHKMHEITVDVTATDDVDANPVIALFGVTSNQGENMTGDGHTSPDIMIKNGRIFLRAERNATMSTDRVYVITYTATDSSGNVGSGFATVTVPHDHRDQE